LVDGPVQTKNRNLPRLLHDGETCHKLDDRCHDQITFSCDKCPGPWYEVVSSGCADEYDKVCGTNHCGTKNAPACPKGKKILPGRLHTEICQTESPYGLCARELKTYCSEGILICL